MILMAACNSCLGTFEIHFFEAHEIYLVQELSKDGGKTVPCPRLCGGKINIAPDPTIAEMVTKLKGPVTLNGLELYQAINGLGLPDERPKDPWTVSAALKAYRVVDAVVENYRGRAYLHELRLEDGTTIHLTGGAHGAMVLKLTKGEVHAG